MRYALLFFPLFGLLAACQPSTSTKEQTAADKAQAQPAVYQFDEQPASLGKYWYQGKAEISRYELLQNRYQDLHPGEAVLIFVTENFLTDKQVKNDNYQNENNTPILKTNMLLKFPTGIYDYSTMTSVFTPTETEAFPQTLKVTNSVQDWCGQSFLQLNFREGQYQMELRSYFENEADQNLSIDYAVLEDELFNRIRINPEGLPTGQLKVVPSAAVIRFMHLPFKAYEAEASLGEYRGTDFEGKGLMAYTLTYPEIKRTLQLVFEKEAPHLIAGWADTYPSAFDRMPRTSLAKRTETLLSPYWQQNSLSDLPLRKDLGFKLFPGK